jgi:endonuclease/exonuclease/phosphatase (EEP) superfamily protein YafD
VFGIVVLAAASVGDVTATPFEPGSRLRWMHVSGGALGGADVIAVHTATPARRHVRQWAAELEMLRSWCGENSRAHIVVGDVNATLDHAPLRAALNGTRDVAADCGQGLIATWPSALPRWLGVQIDHVFTNGGPLPLSLRVLDLPGSDHRAIIAQVVLPASG